MERRVNKITSKWAVTAKRYVCFLDIMGFKDLVSRRSHKQVFTLMKKLSDAKEILHEIFDKHENKEYHDILHTTSFSDSIVVFTRDSSTKSLISLTVAMRHLLESALSKGIPMKGALAFGEISIDKKEQIFFGQALIDAYLLQEDVYYYGVVLHNSAEAVATKILEGQHYVDTSTPLKSGNIHHHNLNWFYYLKNEGQKEVIIKRKFDHLVTKHRGLTSGRPRKYLDNTIQVFKQMYPNL